MRLNDTEKIFMAGFVPEAPIEFFFNGTNKPSVYATVPLVPNVPSIRLIFDSTKNFHMDFSEYCLGFFGLLHWITRVLLLDFSGYCWLFIKKHYIFKLCYPYINTHV
ncbi:hypothetical protein BE843_00525 [Legionella pneumophila subsp. pneumophila]|nr:hypothetical protein BE843_00525 [Legionella pneumophila subsp. pneumophila]AOW60224.1 hypothetical protein BE844_03165 [Legionella pneumophila subsp. pneumophila]AOW65622.1 hypothetical protein BE846_00930 [Legionella pneumophila subsp. pneumophila]